VSEVLPKLKAWVASLDKSDPKYEHHLLEGLWVTWGMNRVDEKLLRRLLQANDYRARAAAVRVLRYAGHQIPAQADLLLQGARDDHGRVRLEAIVAASWLDQEKGMPVLAEAGKRPLDKWMVHAHDTAVAHLSGHEVTPRPEKPIESDLKGADLELFTKGKAIYEREGFCVTCHQADGRGVAASDFPALAGTPWVVSSEERLIKLTLKGLQGPMEVLGKRYPGEVPMTPFEGLLSDEEMAAVLTFVRNSFGNQAPAISPDKVKEVRRAIENKKGFYAPEELLRQHPDSEERK
jgi:mono/diheme cytochrome c family protein